MKMILAALASLALCGAMPALAADKAKTAASRSATRGSSTVSPPDVPRSADAARVLDWIAASGDNRSLPYIVIDKNAAHAFLFDAKGKNVATAPVLIGIAVGDNATPGVGKKSLAEIGPAEKTTPAGRFLAKFGLAAGRQKVLWVDYTTSVALHPIPKGNPKERRRNRMLSPTIEDNRITFGCINVPLKFYNGHLRPLFLRKGGYVYILPDTKPLEEVFPPIRVQPFLSARAG
ncbi:hypothetical protein BV96_02903 [Sphingomonas paucimobilis]|nr:hypothetical protein BV96_02903 [Sphingomonas paucimobilis]